MVKNLRLLFGAAIFQVRLCAIESFDVFRVLDDLLYAII